MAGRTSLPEPPETIPQYIADGLCRQKSEELDEIIRYAEELIEARSKAPTVEDVEEGDSDIMEVDRKDGYTEVIKKVNCGKDCNGCPHGPYVYRVRYSPNGLKWDYLGSLHDIT